MNNNNKKQLLSLILYFGYEMCFSDSDGEEEDTDNKKIANFSEKIVPSMNDRQFKIHFRLEVNVFETLLQKRHNLNKKRTIVSRGHPDISLDKGCMIMIWYLANLESFRSVANRFGISKSTCWAILYKMCKLLLEVNAQYHIIAWPSHHKAETIMQKFQRCYGMPGIIGAIDGTPIRINAPKEDHTSYINRKSYHSILLQGVCDNNLLFTDAYAEQPGSIHDAALLKKSDLYNRITSRDIEFSDNMHLIGDKAYPLTTYLIVPFKDSGNLTLREKNFNLILSKSRAVIENAYALLKGRFRRLKYIETVKMEFIVLLVISATILHNLCILFNDTFEELINLNKEIQEEREAGADEANTEDLRNQDNAGVRKRRDIVNSLPLII